MALGHLAPSPATPVTLTAAGSTTTDTNDRVPLTVVELGLPASWRQLAGSSGSVRMASAVRPGGADCHTVMDEANRSDQECQPSMTF